MSKSGEAGLDDEIFGLFLAIQIELDSSYLAGAIPTNQGLGIGLARANEEWNSISKVPLCQEMGSSPHSPLFRTVFQSHSYNDALCALILTIIKLP
jgi:hypothetical protein